MDMLELELSMCTCMVGTWYDPTSLLFCSCLLLLLLSSHHHANYNYISILIWAPPFDTRDAMHAGSIWGRIYRKQSTEHSLSCVQPNFQIKIEDKGVSLKARPKILFLLLFDN